MKKALLVFAIALLILLAQSLVKAQVPTPPDVPTLGPAIICSSGYSGTNVQILSPQNQMSYPGQVQLSFTVQAIGMFGQFGNVGYSIDGGTINSVKSLVASVDKSGFPDWYWWKTTAQGNVPLPSLSAGVHNVTVYYGWQYLGLPQNPSLERFEVYAHATVNFTVVTPILGNIAINANGSISPTTAPIRQTGKTYSLTNAIQGDITIDASNVIVDGKGYNLIGQVSVVHASNVTVKNFVITETGEQLQGPTVGILLNDTTNSSVSNNTITGVASVEAWNWGPYAAIQISQGTSNMVLQNTLNYNLEGIFCTNTSYNLIKENNVTTNPSIYLYTVGVSFINSSNNIVYHNCFVNAMNQATSSDSINMWDDGYPNGGNYWSDYQTRYPNASMIGNSGVGNTPYFVDGQEKDRYPLMKPFNSTLYAIQTVAPKVELQSPISQTYNESSVTLTFAVDKEFNWVAYSLDNKQNVTITGNNSTLGNLTNGQHTITVYANSTFGTVGASETVKFTIAKPEPFPTTLAATVLVVSSLATIGVFVYFKRRRH